MNDNNDIWADLETARVSYKSKHFHKALQYCDKALDTLSGTESGAAAQAWNIKARAYYDLGRYKQAIFCWEHYPIPAGFVKTWGCKAHAYFELKQYNAALQCYAKLPQLSAEQQNNKVQCLLERSHYFLCQRQFTHARADVLAALEINPKNPTALQREQDVKIIEEIATRKFLYSLSRSSSTSDESLFQLNRAPEEIRKRDREPDANKTSTDSTPKQQRK